MMESSSHSRASYRPASRDGRTTGSRVPHLHRGGGGGHERQRPSVYVGGREPRHSLSPTEVGPVYPRHVVSGPAQFSAYYDATRPAAQAELNRFRYVPPPPPPRLSHGRHTRVSRSHISRRVSRFQRSNSQALDGEDDLRPAFRGGPPDETYISSPVSADSSDDDSDAPHRYRHYRSELLADDTPSVEAYSDYEDYLITKAYEFHPRLGQYQPLPELRTAPQSSATLFSAQPLETGSDGPVKKQAIPVRKTIPMAFTPPQSDSLFASPAVAQQLAIPLLPLTEEKLEAIRDSTQSSPSAQPQPQPLPENALDVYLSEYAGDAFLDGSHKAKITVTTDTQRRQQPLFRWLHLTQKVLHFDQLSAEVTKAVSSDSDRHGIRRLLSEVKQYCIKTIPTVGKHNAKRMVPQFIQVPLPDEERPRMMTPMRTASWLSIPFFRLCEYAGPLTSSSSGAFPLQTLLQAQNSSTSEKRDKLQAVCLRGNASPKKCFHIDQLWCIVLDNSLLFTCGRMPAHELRDNNDSGPIQVISEPPRDLSVLGSSARIYVSWTDAVLWSLSVDECRTWFAFISHFRDFWPRTVRFFHHGRAVNEDDWSSKLSVAMYTTAKLVLIMKLGPPPPPPVRDRLREEGDDDDGDVVANKVSKDSSAAPPDMELMSSSVVMDAPSSTKSESRDGRNSLQRPRFPKHTSSPRKFHVFSWLENATAGVTINAAAGPRQPPADDAKKRCLEEAEAFLLGRKGLDGEAYKKAGEARRADVFKYLHDQQIMFDGFHNQPRWKNRWENRAELVNAADIVFSFFLPVSFDGPTVGKYWGAVMSLVQMPTKLQGDRDERRVEREGKFVRRVLKHMTRPIRSFTSVLSLAQERDRMSIQMPVDLITAWLHIAMSMVYSSQGNAVSMEHAAVARTMIKAGMRQVLEGLSSEGLLGKQAILPMEVVSLVSLKLFNDVTGEDANISDTYSQYLQKMSSKLADNFTTKPPDRNFQHRISLLQDELNIIRETLESQQATFNAVIRSPLRHRRLRDFGDGGAPGPPARHQDLAHLAHGRTHFADKPFVSIAERVVSTQHASGFAYNSALDDWALPPAEFHQLSVTDPGGFRDLLATECVAKVERRIWAFDEYFMRANQLMEESKEKKEDTRERQEMAIYAFTIVTIIFLPLSFVASVFGMNTSDIRGMEQTQWVYWASAIPTTLLIIVVGLWWMNELDSSLSWLRRRRSGRYDDVSLR